MRTVAFLVLVMALATSGCSKKTAKGPAPGADKPGPQPQPAERGKPADKARPDDKKSGGDKPNWLTDPRFASKDKDGKDAGPTLPVDPVSPTGKPSWNLTPPEGGWTPPNVAPPAGANPMAQPPAGGPPVGQPQPAAPGAAPQPGPVAPPAQPLAPAGGGPRNAVQRIVAMNDMRELWLFIENASGASGTMPGPDVMYKALVEVKSPAAELVKDGTISLTGTRTRESVWAYETAALTQGGLVVTQQGVEKLTAAELTQRLTGK